MGAANPFAELERLLLKPPASGMCVTRVPEDSAAAKAGLAAGDIVVGIGGKEVPDLPAFYAALRPAGDGKNDRVFEVLRSSGRVEKLVLPGWPAPFGACAVRKGEAAWRDVPDAVDEPEFGPLKGQICLFAYFGSDPAGFEIINLSRAKNLLEVSTLFRLGGEAGPGETWDYRTRGQSVHLLEGGLPTVETRFWEGLPGAEKLRGDVKLGKDGRWTGRHGTADGGAREVAFAATAPVLPGYVVTLLPLTMPLREGASTSFFSTGDGIGRPTERSRMECLGRRKTTAHGKSVEAWCFAWRHYGARKEEEDEKFYVSDDRRHVRIDWGVHYNDCWCESVNSPSELRGLPSNVKVE